MGGFHGVVFFLFHINTIYCHVSHSYRISRHRISRVPLDNCTEILPIITLLLYNIFLNPSILWQGSSKFCPSVRKFWGNGLISLTLYQSKTHFPPLEFAQIPIRLGFPGLPAQPPGGSWRCAPAVPGGLGWTPAAPAAKPAPAASAAPAAAPKADTTAAAAPAAKPAVAPQANTTSTPAPAPKAADTPKSDAPKAATPAPATESAKAATTAAPANTEAKEAPKAAPAPEAPKSEAPKAKEDAPKADAPKADAPKAEPAKAEAPKKKRGFFGRI